MRRNRMRFQAKIYPIAWTLILLLSTYLLVRFFAVSIFKEDSQIRKQISQSVLSGLCLNILESGSSVISYSALGEKISYAFPVSIMAEEFVVHEFMKDNIPQTILVKEASAYAKQENPLGIYTGEGNHKKTMIHFIDITSGLLSKEYILSNGAVYNRMDQNWDYYFGSGYETEKDLSNRLQIGILEGEVYVEESEDKYIGATETIMTNSGISFTMDQLNDINFLIRNFYIVPSSVKITESLFNAEKLLGMDMTIKQGNEAPQILIYHTHSQEAFADSRPGVADDTVVGIGAYLKTVLEEKYGYQVIHDKSIYDLKNGVLNRSKAYDYALLGIEKILSENPSIEVVIDLHRDGVAKRSTFLNGEETAMIMLLNGLSWDQNGPITRLDNPNLQSNIAFSLQMQIKSLEKYPGLFYKNYLQCWRYNLHVRPKSILMELGTHENTLKSAKNAIEPFAEVLDAVLKGN